MFTTTDNIATPQIYQLLTNGVVPRPIAWVSTLSRAGISNLAPFSFFSVASVNPPVVTVTTVPARDKPVKDTLRNIKETGEAVVHIVTDEFAQVMNASCGDYPADTSEIDALALPTVASQWVAPPSIANTKVRYECKLRDIIEVAPSPGGGVLILLNVVGVYVADDVLKEYNIDPTKLKILGKLGGDNYSDSTVTLAMKRPE